MGCIQFPTRQARHCAWLHYDALKALIKTDNTWQTPTQVLDLLCRENLKEQEQEGCQDIL